MLSRPLVTSIYMQLYLGGTGSSGPQGYEMTPRGGKAVSCLPWPQARLLCCATGRGWGGWSKRDVEAKAKFQSPEQVTSRSSASPVCGGVQGRVLSFLPQTDGRRRNKSRQCICQCTCQCTGGIEPPPVPRPSFPTETPYGVAEQDSQSQSPSPTATDRFAGLPTSDVPVVVVPGCTSTAPFWLQHADDSPTLVLSWCFENPVADHPSHPAPHPQTRLPCLLACLPALPVTSIYRSVAPRRS